MGKSSSMLLSQVISRRLKMILALPLLCILLPANSAYADFEKGMYTTARAGTGSVRSA